jgi:hypothetical protein
MHSPVGSPLSVHTAPVSQSMRLHDSSAADAESDLISSASPSALSGSMLSGLGVQPSLDLSARSDDGWSAHSAHKRIARCRGYACASIAARI